MPILPYKNPLGYRQLRTWQQANEILELTDAFIKTLPKSNPARSHMDRSARSVVRNIEEGFRRTSTGEYISFLGFAAGSNEELLGDFRYCLKGNKGDGEAASRGEYLCKGEGKMLHSQIVALQDKMVKEKTLSAKDHGRYILQRRQQRHRQEDEWLARVRGELEARGDKEIKGDKGTKGDKGDKG